VTHHCVGVYRSVIWTELFLGAGGEYFDEAGQLVGVVLASDYLAYCNGTSFEQAFGRIPGSTCPTQLITQDLCER